MEDLIKALQIFLKYKNNRYPTHCEHDIMMIAGIEEKDVSEEDINKLNDLSFRYNSEYNCWTSYRFGSA